MSPKYTWYDEPQSCPVCKKISIDPSITSEMMEVACSPYGYIQCPEHFPEQELGELKEFLSSLGCVKEFKGKSGPIQDLSRSASAREVGLAIILPLPWGYDKSLPEKIMNDIESWSKKKGWERFGTIVPADCLLLLIGLRKPQTVTA